MKKIDFHIHIFPDRIADKAIKKLSEAASIPAYTNGGLADTLKNMRLNGIDKAVLLTIATNAHQMASVNDFAASVNGDSIIAFGSVYPHAVEEAKAELIRIKQLGFKGIKLHPEYQEFVVNDKMADYIYDFCSKNDLIVSFHCGYDLAYMHRCNCTPFGLRDVAKRFPKLKMVCTHMGGYKMWGDVAEQLAGLPNIWFDTSFTALDITQKQFLDIYNRHNPEQILFGTDCPWSEGVIESKFIDSLPLTEIGRSQIYHINAEYLLNLD